MRSWGQPPSDLADDVKVKLLRFACAFAWLDGAPQPMDWKLVNSLARRLDLPPEQVAKVRTWLTERPRTDDLRIEEIPREVRRLFLRVGSVIADSDAHRHPSEEAALTWLRASLDEIAKEPAGVDP